MKFKSWLEQTGETQAAQAAEMIKQSIQSIQQKPEQFVQAFHQLGIDSKAFQNPDANIRKAAFQQLVTKLESNPNVQKIKQLYDQMKQQTISEGSLDEGVWDVLTTLAKPIVWMAKKSLETISYVLEPIPGVGGFLAKTFAPWRQLEQDVGKNRVEYAGMLLLTFLMSPMLLSLGAATGAAGATAAGVGTAGYSLAWWAYMLFGKAIMEPALKWADG